MAEAAGNGRHPAGHAPRTAWSTSGKAARDPVIAAQTQVIDMLAVKNARLTLPPRLQEACRIGHNILI